MSLESLKLIRNILLRTAVISYAIILISVLITFAFWNPISACTATLLHTTPDEFNVLVANFYTCAKFYVIFILLAPALSLHWTIKASK